MKSIGNYLHVLEIGFCAGKDLRLSSRIVLLTKSLTVACFSGGQTEDYQSTYLLGYAILQGLYVISIKTSI